MNQVEYELTEAEYCDLLNASRSGPYLIANGTAPISPQAAANAVWQRIARERGLMWDSIEPSPKGERFFTARRA